MAHTTGTPPQPGSPLEPDHTTRASSTTSTCRDEAVICERCGKAEMYRMHAVWRCPECGFKTDCCGW